MVNDQANDEEKDGDSAGPDEAPATRSPTSWQELEAIRRVRRLLELSESQAEDRDLRFLILLGALHLVRAIVEHWFTIADLIPARLNKVGKEGDDLKKELHRKFESILSRARRYELITELRDWDYHWGPLTNPETIAPNMTFGRGAPLILSTGPNKGSSVAYRGDTAEVITSGSGRRVGRTNYVRIQKQRFVDFSASEMVPLKLAVEQFLDDLPDLIAEVCEIAEVRQYLST